MTGTMRAWQVVRLGDPASALEPATDVPVPRAGPGQVQVEVSACALNFPDVLLASGRYQVRPEAPFTPGIEVCGTVTALGDGVEGFAVGDRVLGMPEPPHGGLADVAVLPAGQAFAAPSELDDAEAAALFVAYQTGWFGLHRRAALQPGETLLVHAAAGGVGSAAVQARPGRRGAGRGGGRWSREGGRRARAWAPTRWSTGSRATASTGSWRHCARPAPTAPTSSSTRSVVTRSPRRPRWSRSRAGSWSSASPAARCLGHRRTTCC
ncbi:hypothetical protein GCM10025868_10540 [Angustibacter aerolatus]|uniref:Enoyl reductase (ER) domain-containing protein n=1 Tax=Angustibacter aerolatus TaxID=1162965 RepID=A0ABQ6JF90_9ACTN|nr:hypothetical protein GCM10025868_10540 [Angustibacter aerolatus]